MCMKGSPLPKLGDPVPPEILFQNYGQGWATFAIFRITSCKYPEIMQKQTPFVLSKIHEIVLRSPT